MAERSETVRAEVIRDPDAIASLATAWDGLAVDCGRPYCLPGWLTAWWRNAAPPRAGLYVVAVHEGERLIGVAPWILTRERLGVRALRPMGGRISHDVEPLAVRGRERDVAAAVSHALAAGPSAPDVLSFDGIDRRSRWPGDLARAWPGGPAATLTRYELPTFGLSLAEAESFATWYASRSRNFRTNLGYKRRRFEREGGRVRLATAGTLEADLQAFARLHRGRWEHRGGSAYVSDQVERLLADAAGALVPAGRLRLWSLEIDGRIVASQLALAAGTGYAYWLGGFDERYAALSPSLLGILTLIEDAFACGARRVDLGGGSAEYKRRFADDEGTLAWRRVVPRGRRHVVTRLSLAPGQWRRQLSTRVPDPVRARVVAVERRVLARG